MLKIYNDAKEFFTRNLIWAKLLTHVNWVLKMAIFMKLKVALLLFGYFFRFHLTYLINAKAHSKMSQSSAEMKWAAHFTSLKIQIPVCRSPRQNLLLLRVGLKQSF